MSWHRERPLGVIGWHRSVRAMLLLAAAVFCWGGALYILQLDILSGPARQSIKIRWAPQTTEVTRQAAEKALRLMDEGESEPGTRVYNPQDHSREAIRRIVTHPLVEDTSHINRQAFRILIDAPGMPAVVRRLLEADLGPPVAVTLALFGVAAVWLARGQLRAWVAVAQSLRWLEVATALTALAIGFGLMYDNGQAVDENIHYDQIVRLASGDWSLNPALTMLPGFHALVAALAWPAGGVTGFSVRLVVFLLSMVTVGVFHALVRALHSEHAGTRTLQFTLLPVLFPQFFLIYTDVASLLFVLLMMLATVRRRYWLAGALGLVACLMRQDNVLWVAFAMLWSYLRDGGSTWKALLPSLGRYWTFVATGVAFVLFVVVNRGQVALGDDAGSHQVAALHFTNIFFLLFLSCFLFLPLWWGYRREVLTRLERWSTWLGLLVLFAVFWFGFVNDHPHNNERASYFLPNAILMTFSSAPILRLLFFVPVAIAALCIVAVPMRKPWRLLLPFTVLFLLPEWLVVPRYYLIPWSFFLVAREQASPSSERVQTALFAIGSVCLFLVVERTWGWV